MKRRICTALLTLLLIGAAAAPAASAEVLAGGGEGSYTYSNEREPIAAPVSHRMTAALTGEALGVGPLTDIADVAVQGDRLYILEKAAGRVIVVGADHTLAAVLGEDAGLRSPEGFFLAEDGSLYIADTGNARVVKLDREGKLAAVVGAPDPAETLSTVAYEPSKLVVDAGERLYVLANNETNGIFQLDMQGNFLGFFGSVPVVPDLMELFWRTFSTKEQLARMLLFVPTEYSGIAIDAGGFIYTTVATNSDADMLRFIDGGGKDLSLAPIRRLNPKGIDVLVRSGSMPPAGDRIGTASARGVGNASRFIDLTVRGNGTYSALDSTRSRVFTYDADGNLLYLFGANDDTRTGLKEPVALCYWGDRIAVADRGNRAVKLFAPTAYATLIDKAVASDKSGDYAAAKRCWQDVLTLHAGNGLATVGMGKQLLREGRYTEAMDWFRRGGSPEDYSQAFRLYRQQIGYMLTGAAICVLAAGVIALLLWRRLHKRRVPRPRPRSARARTLLSGIGYGFYIMRHPFDGFWDMTFERRGNPASATAILGLTVLGNVLAFFATGYLVAGDRAAAASLLTQGVLSLLLPVGLWCLANWSVTTLMNGSGTLKGIYMYTCYSLTPMLIGLPLLVLLSNLLSLDEQALYTIVQTLLYAWVGFLLFTGTLVVHQYLALRTFATVLVIIVAMGVILFLVLLGMTVVQQMTEFVRLLAEEIQLRA